MELSAVIEWAEKNGWRSEPLTERRDIADHPILSKYRLPIGYIGFLNGFSRLESGDEQSWFLFPDDFRDDADPSGFAWNEFERISAEAALDDCQAAEVREWWSRHLPILMSVRGGYSFYAIETDGGRVVQGAEPEFEEAWEVAECFEDFLEKIVSGEIVP